jgi:glycosyltransferase involved in cell wall biosynthesis
MENVQKRISIMIPTYNEVENVEPLYEAIVAEFEQSLPQYDYDILFIDNASRDGTREKLLRLCHKSKRVRAIFNARNFGQFNSPYHGICATTGDCTISMCADFQDPVEMIPRLVAKWEEGYRIVCAVKTKSRENKLMRFARTCYYKLIGKMSAVEQIEHFTGFGLYDRSFVDVLRTLDDPTPFLRGIVAELGFRRAEIPYTQAKRRAGKTHNSFLTLYDAAMLSFTTYTKAPIRLFAAMGWLLLAASLFLGGALLTRLWLGREFAGWLWLFPALLFCTALILIFLGILGEYLLTLRSKLMRRPLVIEEKRINFDEREA